VLLGQYCCSLFGACVAPLDDGFVSLLPCGGIGVPCCLQTVVACVLVLRVVRSACGCCCWWPHFAALHVWPRVDRSYLLRQPLMAVPACPDPLSRAPAPHQQQRTACVGRYCVLLSRAVLCTACLELYCRYTLCAVCADVHCCCCTYPAIATAEAVWVLWRGLGTVVSLEQV
jgi:hypothetical protein